MNKTAWYDDKIVKEMVKCALGETPGWIKLELTEHFKVLSYLINISVKNKNIADLGCGAGELGRVYKNIFDYTGYDLEHIIEKVSKIVNPTQKYIPFDAYESNFEFLKEFDIVISNGFISELLDTEMIIEKILTNINKYFILHRQEITIKETNIINYKTYGNLNTTKCILNENNLYNLIDKHNCSLVEKATISNNTNSYLIIKK